MANIKRTRVSKSKYYDEEGRLTSEDEVEEIEYEAAPVVIPNSPYWQYPIITNTANTSTHKCMCETLLAGPVQRSLDQVLDI